MGRLGGITSVGWKQLITYRIQEKKHGWRATDLRDAYQKIEMFLLTIGILRMQWYVLFNFLFFYFFKICLICVFGFHYCHVGIVLCFFGYGVLWLHKATSWWFSFIQELKFLHILLWIWLFWHYCLVGSVVFLCIITYPFEMDCLEQLASELVSSSVCFFSCLLVYLIVVGLFLWFCFFYAYLLKLIVRKNCLVI